MVEQGQEGQGKDFPQHPLTIGLNQEFNPFLYIPRLFPSETHKGVFSCIFYLKGVGWGKIELVDPDEDDLENGKLLKISNETAELVSTEIVPTGWKVLTVNFNPLSPELTRQPDIACHIRIKNLHLEAKNAMDKDDLSDGPLFYSFFSDHDMADMAPGDLIVEAEVSQLQNLIFQFTH